MDKISQLKLWLGKHKRLPKAQAIDVTERSLGLFAKKKRRQFKLEELPYEEIIELNNMPYWQWKCSDRLWINRLKDLKEFLKNNERFPKFRSPDCIEKSLGLWICNQKQQYKAGTLFCWRAEALEQEVKGWDCQTIKISRSEKWEKSFKNTLKWVNKYGKLPNPYAKSQHEKSLGIWCNNQRSNKSSGKLSVKREEKLETIKFWRWNVKRQQQLCQT